jgi:hypothetical protein
MNSGCLLCCFNQDERNNFVLQMQNYALRNYKRITFLSGDVHCAAVGLFKTLIREKKQPDVEPPLDHRYMLNIVTSERLFALSWT